MIVGITGTISAGKGKTAEFFKEKGFKHHSFSSTIRAIAKERGIEITRKNLSRLGDELTKEKPDGSIIADKILEKIKEERKKGASKWVLEGIRKPQDIKVFREHEFDNRKMRFILIGVDAPLEIRFERLRRRGRHGDPETLEEFKKIDEKENKGKAGQQIDRCMAMADYIIINDGTIDELKKKTEKIIKEILE